MLCVICSDLVASEQHHIIPKAVGGSDLSSNLISVCRLCHIDIHYTWGPGDSYRGPRSHTELLRRMSSEHWVAWREIRDVISRTDTIDFFLREDKRKINKVRKALWLERMDPR